MSCRTRLRSPTASSSCTADERSRRSLPPTPTQRSWCSTWSARARMLRPERSSATSVFLLERITAMSTSCASIIIGAGPAGLATAAVLQARGLNAPILEKSDAVGPVWRRHYDRLHLHTDRGHSALPGLPMPSSYGRYPSRAQVVEYLESYAATFDLKPRFNTPVSEVRRNGTLWSAKAGDETIEAPVIVIATGLADFPYSPIWPGIETFSGPILHSSRYRNPKSFAGERVLVVGFGHSGGGLALDL